MQDQKVFGLYLFPVRTGRNSLLQRNRVLELSFRKQTPQFPNQETKRRRELNKIELSFSELIGTCSGHFTIYLLDVTLKRGQSTFGPESRLTPFGKLVFFCICWKGI